MADFAPRYVFNATLSAKGKTIALQSSTSALAITLAPLLRGPAGQRGSSGLQGPEGPPGQTPTVAELELPIDPVLIFEAALI